ncbi:MAG: agmatinase [Gammaproteobacteria bacterium]|nr:agmatinase [Gammaproteobacteria bacterium]MYD75138.1 agmatinase [Gammaproteobacteria bacterium]MYJ51552.1 agmatinase [Gammaproteobacteria bacterium]
MMARHDSVDLAFTAKALNHTDFESSFSGALSFARRKYTKNLNGVDLAVTGIPFDTATSNRPGTRFGPRGIRAASTEVAWQRNWPWEFNPMELMSIVDYGDCAIEYGTPQGVPDQIEAHIARIIKTGTAVLSLGGDHFLTLPVLRAHAKRHGPLSLLHFDAHTDTWKDDGWRIDHGTMFYHAVREGLVNPEQSVQVGIRTTNDDPLGFNIFPADWIHRNGTEALVENVLGILGDRKTYLTFDIDCVDPAYAPGTGTPVCGGLSSAQVLDVVRRLRGVNLVGMDLVEVSPPYDHAEITALLGAFIAYDFIALYAAKHKLGESVVK